MLRDDVCDGVALRLLFHVPVDPGALRRFEDLFRAGLAVVERPIVEIGRVVQMARHAVRIELYVEHALGDDPAIPRARQARILDGVLQIEKHARLAAVATLVDQHRAPFQQVAVSFQRQVDDRIQQWVPGTHERRQRLPLRRRQGLLEGDALVAAEDRSRHAHQAVPVPNGRGNVGDLVTAGLTLPGGTAQAAKRLVEERLDVVRLQAAGIGPLHFLSGFDAPGWRP